MAKSKEQKKEILDALKDKLAKSKSVVFSSDEGATVKSVETLRKELKQNGAEYFVTKKTLLKLATKDLEGENQVENLKGSVGVTLSYDDEVAGARLVNKFAKDKQTFELSGGILEGAFILPEKIKTLANLPSKEQLLATVVGTIKAPITGLVGVLSGNTRNLVGVLNAIKEKKS